MYSKQAFKFFITFMGLFISIFFIALLIYDPLQLYHNKPGREGYANEDRESIPFLIKSIDFDSVIVGSSVSQNISARETSKKLGGKYFNISMLGANPYVTKKVLKSLFKRKEIENVVYFVDIYYLDLNKEGRSCPPLSTWQFLYDDNPLNDIKIYFNDKYLKCLLKFSNSVECIGWERNLDAPYAWNKIEQRLKPFGGFGNWIKYYKENPEPIDELASINLTSKLSLDSNISNSKVELIRSYLDDNIIYFVKKYPNTNFYVVMSPVPTLYWAIHINKLPIEEKIALKFLTKKAQEYKNLKIYFFDNLIDTNSIGEIGDIKLYKDFVHHEHKVDSYIIDSIRDDKNIVTVSNLDKKYQQLIHKINNYNYQYYVKQAKECIAKNHKSNFR